MTPGPRNGGDAQVAITSLAPGSSFAPGDALLVEVTGSADVVAIQVAVGQTPDALVFADASGPSPSALLEIPATANGAMNVLAMGFDVSGALVALSEPVAIDVVVPAELEAITVYPATVYLQPCDSASLEISGHYADTVVRSLAAVPDLSFAFAEGHADRSGARGVQLLQTTDDTLTVSLGEVSSPPVAIRALPGAEPPAGGCPVPEPSSAAAALVALVALADLSRRRRRMADA